MGGSHRKMITKSWIMLSHALRKAEAVGAVPSSTVLCMWSSAQLEATSTPSVQRAHSTHPSSFNHFRPNPNQRCSREISRASLWRLCQYQTVATTALFPETASSPSLAARGTFIQRLMAAI